MRLPAKNLASCLTALALVLSGCGGDGDDGSGGGLDAALRFLPRDAPFVVAIDTDVDGAQYERLEQLVDRLPLGDQFVPQLQRQLESSTGGLSYEQDLRPLLGHPFVVGAVDARSFVAGEDTDDFVGAVEARDGDKLRDVLERSGAKRSGERSGATIYEDGGDRFAVAGDMLIVAGSDELLDQALMRANGDDRLDEKTFDDNLARLPGDALLRAYFDVAALLRADPGSRDALEVKWVGALRTLGLTARGTADGIDVDVDLWTDGDLSDRDLPIAAGSASPDVLDERGQINIGLRDLRQLIRFAEAAGQSIDPAGFGQYSQAKRQLDKRLGVDIDHDVIGQLSGDVSANVGIDGAFGVRAELEDPAAFERTLAKVADVLPDVAEGAGFGTVGLAKPKSGEDFYALAQSDGDSVVFGVVDDAFVLANDASRAGRLATEDPLPVDGARGAIVLKAGAGALARMLLGAVGGGLGVRGLGIRLLAGSLGDLTGSLESSSRGLEGTFSLPAK